MRDCPRTDPAAARNLTANLGLVEEYTRRAADAGASLVLFPEATMCRFGVPLAPIAEPLDGSWASAVRAIAERAGIVVVAGMFVPAEEDTADGADRVTNTLIATGPGVDTHYDKIHLYDAFGFTESDTVAPGTDAGDDHGRWRAGTRECRPDTVLRRPLPRALRRIGPARSTTHHCATRRGAPAPASSSSGRCWRAPAPSDTTGFVAAVDQAYPGDELAAVGPVGVGGSRGRIGGR